MEQEPPKKFKFYYYILGTDNDLLDGIRVEFRADDREEADSRANEEASMFGEFAYATFIKFI